MSGKTRELHALTHSVIRVDDWDQMSSDRFPRACFVDESEDITATMVSSVLRGPGVEGGTLRHLQGAFCGGSSGERRGEPVRAVVVPSPDKTFDPDDLRSFCAERLAKEERAERICVRGAPLNASGEILKAALRDELATTVEAV